MLQLEGTTLSSRFLVQCRLRCGSYAELFLARDNSRGAGELVVIKALNVWLQGQPTADLAQMLVECVAREARALTRCKHENIVRLLDHGAAVDKAARDFHFLALEYLPGGSLRECLQKGRMTLASALPLLGQVSAALSCIQRHGLVHRDVKPANIMLSRNHDVAKLIDLGTIRALDDCSQITEIGTPVYAAPEQYASSRARGASLTAATDVYALAKTA